MTRPTRGLTIAATRPDRIKRAPIVKALPAEAAFDARRCVTAAPPAGSAS